MSKSRLAKIELKNRFTICRRRGEKEKMCQNEIGDTESYTTKQLQKDDRFNKNIKYAVAKISAGALLGCSAYFLNSFGVSIQFGVILFLFLPVGLFAGFLLAMPQLQAIQKM
jgi:hypothetical protein